MKSTVKREFARHRSVPLLAVLTLLAVIATIATFAYVSRVEEHGEKYFSRVSEQRVLGQQIAKYALESSAGDPASFDRLRNGRDRFITLVAELKSGSPEAGLPPTPERMAEPLQRMENSWLALRAFVDEILLNQKAILSIREFVEVINREGPRLQQVSEEVVNILVKTKADQQQVYIATRQLMLAQRLQENVNSVLEGGTRTALSIDQFSKDTDRFGRVLNGMLTGDLMGVSGRHSIYVGNGNVDIDVADGVNCNLNGSVAIGSIDFHGKLKGSVARQGYIGATATAQIGEEAGNLLSVDIGNGELQIGSN